VRVLRGRSSLLLRPGSIEVVRWRVPLLLLLLFFLLDLWRRLSVIDGVLSPVSKLYDVVQEVVVFVVDLRQMRTRKKIE